MPSVVPTTSHWGAYGMRVVDDEVVEIIPHPSDPDPSPLLAGIIGAAHHRTRVQRPAIRRGWLEHGPSPTSGRGREDCFEVHWDGAIQAVASEIDRVRTQYGNESLYGGSYGWASAVISPPAQSKMTRMFNLAGG